MKRSERLEKASHPGIHQVRRFRSGVEPTGDVIWDVELGIPEPCTAVDVADPTSRRTIPEGTAHEDLLVPVFRAGRRVYEPPPLMQVRQRTLEQLEALPEDVRRLAEPSPYPVGRELGLHDLEDRLLAEAGAGSTTGANGARSNR